MKKYLRAVKRRLNMPRELRQRVIHDLESSVTSRLEAGQSREEILAELGTPRQAAKELNRQMQEFTYKKSPWRWACLVLTIVSILLMLFHGSLGLITALFNFQVNHSSIGIIGGADGPTSVFVTAPAGYFSQQTVMAGILLIMSVLGYWALSHMKRK